MEHYLKDGGMEEVGRVLLVGRVMIYLMVDWVVEHKLEGCGSAADGEKRSGLVPVHGCMSV